MGGKNIGCRRERERERERLLFVYLEKIIFPRGPVPAKIQSSVVGNLAPHSKLCRERERGKKFAWGENSRGKQSLHERL